MEADTRPDINLIQDELVNILIAGRDTTASCITFAIYLLSQHPDVLLKLSAEVHSILGASTDSAPTLDTMRQMPYLRATINETLRLFPSVPMNVRDSVAERVLTASDGTRYYLPAGTGITYSLLHIHRSPRYWGPTAAEFSPERFLATPAASSPSSPPSRANSGDIKDGTHSPAAAVGTPTRDGRYETYYANTPFVFMPFNAGPRSCLGQQLAYAEVGVFLCRLVQRLRVRQGVGRERIVLDEEAIPEGCRVPRCWSEEEEVQPSVCASAGAEKGEGLPVHASRVDGTQRGMLPPTTSSGVSPRRMIEKVWPKSHLTMFVEGGVWIRV